MSKVGCGILLKLDFADGGICDKERTFLIIDQIDDKLHLLNISSVKGKEWKLGYKSNKEIKRFKPPFLKYSFAKLDALYIISAGDYLEQKILFNKRKMFPAQLEEIKNTFYNYREKNNINIKQYDENYVIRKNGL